MMLQEITWQCSP